MMHGGWGCCVPIKKLFIFTLNNSSFAKKRKKKTDPPLCAKSRKSITL